MAHLCDTNVWLALALSGHRHHSTSRVWLESVEEPASILFCRTTQQSLLRLLTNAAVLAPYGNPPLTNLEAWGAYEAFIADHRMAFQAEEPGGIERYWQEFGLRPTASPKLWTDAYLAAFARSAGYKMVTTDSAFKQFQGLDLILLA
jgi:toxin-antitoxin system PIN domain toxin